jgi:Signal peptide peptidase
MRLCLLAALLLLHVASAVLPTADLALNPASEGGGHVAVAEFSSAVPEAKKAAWMPMLLPEGDATACDEVVTVKGASTQFILVAERGNCTFDAKAQAAVAVGAAGLVVVNTLKAVYAGRDYGDDRIDYECSNGQGWLQTVQSPVWSAANDVPSCSSDARCSSGHCIVTNTTDAALGTRVCCAWDMYMTMGASSNETGILPVQAVFMPLAQGAALLSNPLLQKGEGDLQGRLSDRPRPYLNLASLLLWALGVATAVLAAWRSADEVRSEWKAAVTGSLLSSSGNASSSGSSSAPPALELTLAHTVGFIVFASGMLLLLFTFNLTSAVTALYCLSAGSALGTLLVAPALRPLLRRLHGTNDGPLLNCGKLGEATVLELASLAVALSIALWWALVRGSASYAWLLQDAFGCCLCVAFMGTLRVNSLKVAGALLSMAFFYDIFWVFISPALFSESVMVAVATGGEPTADPTVCEKYPHDSGCRVSSLPMLLQLPRLGDYQGGYVMLGLGDIVLPGLLLSFAARYDASVGLPFSRGYFAYMVGGYAAGLLLANLAVIITG